VRYPRVKHIFCFSIFDFNQALISARIVKAKRREFSSAPLLKTLHQKTRTSTKDGKK